MDSLSVAQARRVAVAAQGLAEPRVGGRVDRRHVRRVFDRLGVVQIDSVNVVVRSHYLPLFARLGPYPSELLDRAAYRDRELFEYWGHEASFLPMALHPLMRWKMAREHPWGGMRRLGREHRRLVEQVYDEVAARGPIAASELSQGGERRGPWWGWSDGKRALEWLFWTGSITTAHRRNFERVYDVTERVIPADVLAAPTPSEGEARRRLLVHAARALGVATAADLADYFRMKVTLARPRLAEAVEAGELVPVRVEGWREDAYLHPEARVPRRVRARSLLSPFDSLVWFRARTERLFDFRYRIEIYTPAPKRVHGYYVLPFLLGDRLVARVDVKADRKARRLLALGAFAEPGVEVAEVAAALSEELALLATWLDLDGVTVGDRGDLAPALARAGGVGA